MRKPKATVEQFINSSEPFKKKVKSATFKRETFSLNEEYSNLINKLIERGLDHKDEQKVRIKLNRSDIVKMGLQALSELNDDDFITLTRGKSRS